MKSECANGRKNSLLPPFREPEPVHPARADGQKRLHDLIARALRVGPRVEEDQHAASDATARRAAGPTTPDERRRRRQRHVLEPRARREQHRRRRRPPSIIAVPRSGSATTSSASTPVTATHGTNVRQKAPSSPARRSRKRARKIASASFEISDGCNEKPAEAYPTPRAVDRREGEDRHEQHHRQRRAARRRSRRCAAARSRTASRRTSRRGRRASTRPAA